ncbi:MULTISPECIES: hypothetical protein [unclassified Novosphingobium]|uniref:hypothetical protein n=1 Tax=Novosphingobium TaxID=165696 RepID=UPI001447D4E7|nr:MULTISPECIES: hypothetical protein [unclassified Novosphingobium]NKJ41327.1 hypothetical protein [Novosphingobium sp. SG720]NMN03576.1 hypothetical protein [Novosphingobium sp. SG919]NMN86434.1 hypothetical protein [Novosphingobium sp. SG916]
MTTPAIPETAPQASGLRRWSAYLGPAVSVAILGAVLWQLRQLNWLMVVSIIPRSPLIWLVLAASYFAGPVADWVIFRKLWGIPFSGLAPLLKKLVGNELLLGYVGEVYFYDWARRHVKMEGSPFGAVKDVAILSALAGNIITIGMMGITWYVSGRVDFGQNTWLIVSAIGFALATSLVITFLRKGIFSLSGPDLWFVFVVHCLRIAAGMGFTALSWHLILPEVSIGTWILFSTIRLLVARLPFIPNKDIAFAGITPLIVGKGVQTDVMIAMISMLIVATHVILFIGLMLLDLVQKEKNA